MIIKQLLDLVINVALIVALLAVIYAIIWTAIFFPIIKLRKHKQKVFEMEREYNKIEVEYATTMRLKDATDEKLRQTLFILSQKEQQLEKINKELEKKDKETNKKKTK